MRLELTQAATKVFKFFLISYAIVSVIYTATYLYTTYSGDHHDIIPRAREQQVPLAESLQQLNEHTVVWSNAQGSIQAMPEQFLMTKIFSDSMGPSNLTPYFFRAKANFDKEDITMTTLVTRNRFPVLSRLATNHKGKKNLFSFDYKIKLRPMMAVPRPHFCRCPYQR